MSETMRHRVGDAVFSDPSCRMFIAIARMVHGEADTRMLNTLLTESARDGWNTKRIVRMREKVLAGRES